MPDYAALKAELAGPGYQGLDDAAAAEAFNGATVEVDRPIVPISSLRIWAAASGARKPIRAAALGDNAALASIALVVEDMVAIGDPLDLSDPRIVAMLGALVQGGVLTGTQRDSLLALGKATVPRWQSTFGAPATRHDVARARTLTP